MKSCNADRSARRATRWAWRRRRSAGASWCWTRSGGTLTHAGRLVAEFVGPVIANYDALCADLNDLSGLRRQLIRIAATPSVAFIEPGVAIAHFREKYDSVVFRFDVQRLEEIVTGVKMGTCDIGISLMTKPDPEIQVLSRFPEPIALAVRKDHPLASRETISLQDVTSVPLALLDGKYSVRRLFDEECRRCGLTPTIVLESCDLLMLMDFVRNGGCASLMPRRTIQDPMVTAVPVESDVLNSNALDLIVLRHRRLPRLIRLFVQELTDHLARNARDVGAVGGG